MLRPILFSHDKTTKKYCFDEHFAAMSELHKYLGFSLIFSIFFSILSGYLVSKFEIWYPVDIGIPLILSPAVANNSHLVFMVACSYDSACFFLY